ncbi:hypothetical protein HDV01_006081 [Terramyces sp. JEL0728]|nr:hypothetical protein HDV01_006081 [Terramyces sp. JEL0728]
MELSQNPTVRNKLYNEVKDVDFESENLAETISKLKYLDCCFKEALRLHSAAPNVLRTAIADTTIKGYEIKKGQQIILNFRGIHLSEKNYSNALEFNPDRWNQPAAQAQGAYMPFGDGPHMCIGQKLAIIEAKIIVLRLIQKFDFDIVPNHPLDAVSSITYGLKHGLLVNVKGRK